MSFSLAPKFYNGQRNNPTLYTGQAGQKQTSLVLIGGSVLWGNGLDMTAQYPYLIQQRINSTLGVDLGNWAARSIHTDDYCEGGPASGGTPSYTPFNGNSQSSGYAAGIDSPSAYNFNAQVSPFGAGNYGRSKFNFDPYNGTGQPTTADSTYGIFNQANYGGSPSPSPGTIRLDASGKQLRLACNVPVTGGYLVIVASSSTGSGAVNIYGAGGFVGSTFTNWAGLNYSGSTFSNPFNMVVNNTTPSVFIMQIKTDSGNTLPQGIALNYNGGSVDIHAIWVTKTAQASNHILVQTVARNSYCLQDFNQSAVLTAIQSQVINSPSAFPSTCSLPYYVIGDAINSLVTSGRNFTPSGYASYLEGMALSLESGSVINGKIILAVPPRTQVPGFYLYGGSAWVGSGMSDASNGPYQWRDYWESVYAVAAKHGWGFLDLMSTTSSISSNQSAGYTGSTFSGYTGSFFQPDGLHPTPTGATAIANQYIAQLGL